jgi:hypothetical protein
MAGLMQLLGLHVPQPEVVPDATNPKGFAEPQWTVDFHDRLLAEAVVTVSDSRPSAWFETGRVATREPERIRASEWLESHLVDHPELVVKDPRLSWFLGLWRVAAVRSGSTPVFATMLRPPAEVVGSKQLYYRNKLGAAHLTSSWVNMLLHTERATRDSIADGGRAFVQYADLLDDWTKVTMSVAERLGLENVLHAKSEQIRDGHRFIDPTLRRVSVSLDDLGLPPRLHDLTGETWSALTALTDPEADTLAAQATLDELREAYVALYEEAESISKSSVVAATSELRRRLQAPANEPAAPRQSLTDKIPHGVRAAVPPSLRRRVRKAIGRPR